MRRRASVGLRREAPMLLACGHLFTAAGLLVALAAPPLPMKGAPWEPVLVSHTAARLGLATAILGLLFLSVAAARLPADDAATQSASRGATLIALLAWPAAMLAVLFADDAPRAMLGALNGLAVSVQLGAIVVAQRMSARTGSRTARGFALTATICAWGALPAAVFVPAWKEFPLSVVLPVPALLAVVGAASAFVTGMFAVRVHRPFARAKPAPA